MSPEQQAARAEWRNLCFTLEGLQASELLGTCGDRFAFVRTYQVYARQHELTTAAVRREIAAGDYRFFTVRGVPTATLTTEFARLLLRDWSRAVALKQTRLAEGFLDRFDREIDMFERIALFNWAARSELADRIRSAADLLDFFGAKNAARISQTPPVDPGNALLLAS